MNYRTIPERDWKYASKLKSKFLDRLCQRINSKSLLILNDLTQTQHDRYLSLYRHIKESDRLIALGFNDWKRSMAFQCLTFYRQQGLMTNEEYDGLSDETKQVIALYLGTDES